MTKKNETLVIQYESFEQLQDILRALRENFSAVTIRFDSTKMHDDDDKS